VLVRSPLTNNDKYRNGVNAAHVTKPLQQMNQFQWFSVHFTGYFKKEKKEKEGELVSCGHPLSSLPQAIMGFP